MTEQLQPTDQFAAAMEAHQHAAQARAEAPILALPKHTATQEMPILALPAHAGETKPYSSISSELTLPAPAPQATELEKRNVHVFSSAETAALLAFKAMGIQPPKENQG